MTSQSSNPPPSPQELALVSAHALTKIYIDTSGRPVRALENVTFDVTDGEFVSVLGPSGCGKSTMLMMIAGLRTPTGGDIAISGRPVQGPQTDIGIVFQQDVLLEWRTALGNVLLQMEARGRSGASAEASARNLLGSIGLRGFENTLPRELSGGMRQRVAICRALIHEPTLILMDEPFGALDAITRDQLGLDLLHLWDAHKRTALLVTHSIPEAVFLSDRVIVMTPRPGRIESVVSVNLPRPRTLEMKETPEFNAAVAEIRRVFLAEGVLHD
jgi:NitT/TauT family transport system ATP-binding protein